MFTLPQTGWLPNIKYVQIQTHSRCNADCWFPLAGSTLVATKAGDRPIGDLCGQATLLVPSLNNGSAGGSGVWQAATVRSYGVQPVCTVKFRRGKHVKRVSATPAHLWSVKHFTHHPDGRCTQRRTLSTSQLKPGDVIPSCKIAGVAVSAHPIRPSAFAVAQGFTFGDGSRTEKDNRPASVRFYAEKDAALLPYFATTFKRQAKANGKLVWEACDLPRTWKDPPSLDESKSFLLGWLAGYFAADGTVNKRGNQAVLYSAQAEHVEIARTVCQRLGVTVSPVRSRVRVGFGVERPLHAVSLAVRDLPIEFWLQEHHRDRVLAAGALPRRDDWIVEDVVAAPLQEEVFCATVPGVECFTLADELLTHNCPYIESEHAADPGTMPDELWHHILSNLRPFADGINQGKVCPYLMQEPLIDKSIFSKIDDVYRCFPNTCVEISTNGAALTDKVVDRLFTCFENKRHDLWVSHHGIDAETLQYVMKIDYEKAHNNLINLLKKSDGRFKIKIRGAGESRDGKHVLFTGKQYLEYWKKNFRDHTINTKNVDVDAFTFHDRAGTLHREDRSACNLKVGKVRDIGPGFPEFYCGRLDEWVHFDYKGDIRLCCHDYHHEIKLPNIRDVWLVDYYHSKEYLEIVEMISGVRESPADLICKRCNSPGG